MRDGIVCTNFYITILVILLLINCGSIGDALKCYKCNSLEGFKDFDPDCAKNPAKGRAPMESGFTACLKSVVKYMGKPVTVRFGIVKSNEPLVCGRNNATIKIGTLPINSYQSCDICSDKDGCNGNSGARSNFLRCGADCSTLLMLCGLLFYQFLF